MADRVTITHLRGTCEYINNRFGKNYRISEGFRGYSLVTADNREADILTHGHIKASDLYQRMQAYIKGLEETANR